ncbi:helix-turn-helix domain-containing protein [Streptomyces sp. NPDC057381]|uniref:helix-turn-helix domain-containing protein n=1 Tax=Streptomyces sp. NPDC057381 TaxID=3346111 RepID=UPI003631CAEE
MTQEPAPDWSARIALSVAREVRRHRQAKGLSAQQLSDRCARVGMPIQRSVLANLESGRRTTVTIAEVLVLAAALEIPPTSLIVPVGFEEESEVLPGRPGDSYGWAFWVTGEAPLIGSEATVGDATAIRRRLADNPLNRLRAIRKGIDRYIDLYSRYTDRMEESLERLKRNNRDRELLNAAMSEVESIMHKREALLDSIDDEDDPADMTRLAERRRALRLASDDAMERVAALRARVEEYRDDQQEVEAYRVAVEKAKQDVVTAVDEMREAGWIVPDLGLDIDSLREPSASVFDL